MKVVLSRKGMDSTSGGIPSPILPDWMLLSFPIPDGESGLSYDEVAYKGLSYKELIHQLHPTFDFEKNAFCHLDPDLYDISKNRPADWKPAFGQCGISAKHLDRMGVGVGDVFLFYGMFQPTEYRPDGTLTYKKKSPVQHIIYGYLRVGEVLKDPEKIKKCYPWHPHAVGDFRTDDRLYLPADYGVFSYDKELILSKPGQPNRRLWSLPAFFAEKGISISWQGEKRPTLVGDRAELNSACRGQEFVVTAEKPELERELFRWVEKLTGRAVK